MATQSRCLIWASVVFALLFLPIVLAEQEVKTIEYGIGYVASPTANTIYSKNITFNPPDGSSKIIASEVTLTGDYQANTLVRASVRLANGTYLDCNPTQWVTPNLVVTNYQMVFDCTNLLNGIKTFTNKEIGFRLNRTAVNNKASMKMTYYNNPLAKLTVFGTEYFVDDVGKLWVHVIDSSNKFVDNATCYLNVYYPFNTIFIENVSMIHLSNGIYYYDFIVPHNLGVYPAVALCYYDTSQQIETADSGAVIKGGAITGTYVNTLVIDGSFWKIEELKVGSNYMLDFVMNFTGITEPALLTSLNIKWLGKWNGVADNIRVWIQNQTSKQWILLTNVITDTGGLIIDFSTTITINNATRDGYLKNGIIMLRFNDTVVAGDIVKSQIQSDYVSVDLVYQAEEQVSEVKGSSELHVTSLHYHLPFIVDLGCEVVDEYKKYSSCARFITSGEYEYIENELVENLTITSLVAENETETEWIYWTPVEVDCTAVYNIMFWNGSHWVDVTENAEMFGIPENANCEIRIPVVANVSDVYHYYIIMDNYLKWDIEWIKTSADTSFLLIENDCKAYALMVNYTFTVPILKSTYVSSDFMLKSCHIAFDDKYWVDLFYNQSLTIANVGEYYSYYTEYVWYKTTLINQMGLSNLWFSKSSFYALQGLDANMTSMNASLSASILNLVTRIQSTNETIHAKLTSIESRTNSLNQTLYEIMAMVLSVNETAKKINASCTSQTCNQTELMNMIISINNTNRLIQINQSLWEKIDSLNPILNDIYSLVQLNNQSLYSLTQTTLQMNQTQFNQLQNLATLIQTNYNLINNVYGQVNATNLTIMNKLYSVQGDLQNIYTLEGIINNSVYVTRVNVTIIYDLLLIMNQSISNINVSVDTTKIENMIVSVNSSVLNELNYINNNIINISTNLGLVNQSIFNKLITIQGDLDTIGSTVSITQLNVTSIYDLLLIMNQSIANINVSINTSYLENLIYSVNSSVFGELYSIHSELNDMTNTLLNITVELGLINNSLYYNIVSVQNSVNGLYSLINNINTTTMNKLYKIQDEIASVNDTVLATNVTIMNKLYLIQNDLDNLLADLTNQLANITNLTIDITANLTSTAEDVWDVFFRRGTPPLLPSTSYYCSSNATLIKDMSYSFYEGNKWVNTSKLVDMYCEYGCNNGTIFFHADCNPSPTYNYLYVILIVIIIFLVALFILRGR